MAATTIISKEDMQLYLSEATWKYNYRNNPNAFSTFITGCFAG